MVYGYGVSYSSRRRRIRKNTAAMLSEVRQILDRVGPSICNGPCVISPRPDLRVPLRSTDRLQLLEDKSKNLPVQAARTLLSPTHMDASPSASRSPVREMLSPSPSPGPVRSNSPSPVMSPPSTRPRRHTSSLISSGERPRRTYSSLERPRSQRTLFCSPDRSESDTGAMLRQILEHMKRLERRVEEVNTKVEEVNTNVLKIAEDIKHDLKHDLATQIQSLKDGAHSTLEVPFKQLSEIKEAVQHLMTQAVSAVNHVAPPENLDLPLATLSALVHLESQLAEDSSLGKDIVSHLATKGGKDVKDALYRMMPLLMTDAVAKQLNWTGNKKMAFCKLKITAILHKSIRSIESCKAVTEEELQTQLIRYLKGASDRDGGRKKPESPVTELRD